MLRCQLVVWHSHTPRRRLDWHRNSPRRGPDPKPDSLLGLRLSDVVSPWARPELVLGVAGIAGVRHWAHASVADAMAEQCPHCVDRLRQRLGAARADLGDGPGADPIRLPGHRLQGEQGLLGPFAWWRLPRADGRWTTVWRLRRQPLWAAQGLLNQGAPPDGRDADLALLQQSSLALAALARPDGSAARFVGEQGRPMDSSAPARHAAYWQALQATAAAAIERGDDEAAAAPPRRRCPAGRLIGPGTRGMGSIGNVPGANSSRACWPHRRAERVAGRATVQRGWFQRSLR